jgi:molybdenum transport protein
MLRDAELERLLLEDVPYGDLTSELLELGSVPGQLSFVARRSMTVCCTEEAARLFGLCGGSAQWLTPSGTTVSEGARLLVASGPASTLLAAWKVAQNLVEWTSGIAGATAGLLAAAREGNRDVAVACTRKAFPGTRALAVRAVRAGGASMHRLGLSDSLLVFPEHRAFDAEVTATQWLARLRLRERERRVTFEVTTLQEALALAEAGAEALQLEHFSPPEVASCKARLDAAGLRPLLLAAGGVNVTNAAAFARAGAQVLVSSAPYQAAPADVKVVITRGA